MHATAHVSQVTNLTDKQAVRHSLKDIDDVTHFFHTALASTGDLYKDDEVSRVVPWCGCELTSASQSNKRAIKRTCFDELSAESACK